MASTKEDLLGILKDLGDEDFKEFKWFLQQQQTGSERMYPGIPLCRLENAGRTDAVDLMTETYMTDATHVTETILQKMKKYKLLQKFTKMPISDPSDVVLYCQKKLRSNLQQKFQCIFEGVAEAGNPIFLNKVYTELSITEGEHEIRQIESASWSPDRPEIPLNCEDIFRGPAHREEPIRTVLTKGIAGIGKTVLTQKFSLDWAEGWANQDIQLLFPFTFRELNVLRDSQLSLVGLLHQFFSESAGLCSFEHLQVVFIFDGLDECRLPLDFTQTPGLTETTESVSVDVLLVNLIRGTLLPAARLWITTRPAAANQIPAKCISMVTEVRGFTDPQKEQYFRKRFRDQQQATAIISHIRTSRSLHIMSHIPIFCWILSTVLHYVMETGATDLLPQTLTEIYIHFLVVQAKVKCVKYDGQSEIDQHWTKENVEMVKSLAKLAFEQLQKGNLIFYESDLREAGIDIEAASKYSGYFTAILKKEKTVKVTVFCFVHLSVQEFLAALHVHLTFLNSGVNLFEKEKWHSKLQRRYRDLRNLHRSAVDQALVSPNGHLDLLLRFLLGLSLETEQSLLQGLLRTTRYNPESSQKTIDYIKQWLNKDLPPERSINLLHCLNELRDRSLVEDIQQYLRSGGLYSGIPTPAQWAALVFILLSSNKNLKEFDLRNYGASEEALQKLLPVVKVSTTALLTCCNLTWRSCAVLATVLSSPFSSLKELDLSNNDLQDSGVEQLSKGLQSPMCKLKILRLCSCNLTETSCTHFSSVHNLRELDLSDNELQDSGVKKILSRLRGPLCKVETLRLSGCRISEEGCASLVSALHNHLHLRELDLSYNHPGDTVLESLRGLQKDPSCSLDTLRVDHCGPSRLITGPRKYSCDLSLDPATAHKRLKLSSNNKMATAVKEEQPYPDHLDRFDSCTQVLCLTPLTGRCYWEVQWSGQVEIAVTKRSIRRKGHSEECMFGWSDCSWDLKCDRKGFFLWNNRNQVYVRSSVFSERVAVYLDCPAGALSFYAVSDSREQSIIHTFHHSFIEPLFAGFGFGSEGSSVSLV